jgi:hypothetical protein
LHKSAYASRKLVTELIDVSGHVVIGQSRIREKAVAQAGERVQGLRQCREGPRAAFGVGRGARQWTELGAHRLLGFELALHQPLDPFDRHHSFSLP